MDNNEGMDLLVRAIQEVLVKKEQEKQEDKKVLKTLPEIFRFLPIN